MRLRNITIFLAFLLLAVMGGGSTGASPQLQTGVPTVPAPTLQATKPILLTDPVVDPKQPGVTWFASTGHTLRGAFLDYWTKYGGLAQFGYPLTEEFFEPVGADNKLYQVQYFERNRFEYHPENAGTQYEVLLGALGLDLRQANPPAAPIAGATYFKETGHNLSGAFKQYWETHGGLFVHGLPITEPVQEKSATNGKEYTVQWFERSRFELHPENKDTPYEVLLGLLGTQLSQKKGYPYGWYPPFGYAPDFSWVAGELVVYHLYTYCHAADCGCNLNLVDGRDTYMQMVNTDDPMSPVSLGVRTIDPKHNHYVFFGRKVNPSEQYKECAYVNHSIGYLTKLWQRNPAP